MARKQTRRRNPETAPETGAETPATPGAAGNGRHRLLTVEDILKADDVRTRRVHVPEWGGDVILSSPTAAARDRFSVLYESADGKKRELPTELLSAAMVAMSVVGEDGEPLFTPEDVPRLARKNADVINRLWPIASELGELARRVNAALEDAAGN